MGKIFKYSILGFVGLLFIVFILNLVGLGFFKFFGPKYEDVKREIWEETKSRVHGTISDIAEYYRQSKSGTTDKKVMISEVIKQRFPEFDANYIKSEELRKWFIKMRGY